MLIDLRKKNQHINGWYIWVDKLTVRFGRNGTSTHYTLKRKENSNSKIKIAIADAIKKGV